MAGVGAERVLSVYHWNDSLFSFTTTRDPGLRFENGHFVMVGETGSDLAPAVLGRSCKHSCRICHQAARRSGAKMQGMVRIGGNRWTR